LLPYRFLIMYEFVITARNLKVSLSLRGGIGWMLGLMTGNNSGVSSMPLLVFSLPILPNRSFSLISKLKMKPKQDLVLPYKRD